MLLKLLAVAVVVGLAVAELENEAMDGAKLVLTQIVWRHGDRSPTEVPPSDPNTEDKWPQGFGQLTTRGMKEQQNLGALIKSTYTKDATMWFNNTKLNPVYTRDQVYMRSDSEDRCLMSAYSNLVGLFGDPSATSWPDQNGWPTGYAPIPVHTVERKRDHMLNTGENCPRADKLQDAIYNNALFTELTKMNSEFLGNLANWTGYDNLKVKDLWKVRGAAYIERYWDNTDGVSVVEMNWVNKTVNVTFGTCPGNMTDGIDSETVLDMTEMVRIIDQSINQSINKSTIRPTCVHTNVTAYEAVMALDNYAEFYYYSNGKTTDTEFPKLVGGELLRTIEEVATKKWLCMFDSKVNPMSRECMEHSFNHEADIDVNNLLYVGYSAHDTTVLSFLRTMQNAAMTVNLSSTGLPKYAAAVAVELWAIPFNDSYTPSLRLRYHDGQYFADHQWNAETWETITQTISGCPDNSTMCSWDTFTKRNVPFLSSHEGSAHDCRLEDTATTTAKPGTTTCPAEDDNVPAIAAAIVFGVLTAIFAALATFFYMKIRSAAKSDLYVME